MSTTTMHFGPEWMRTKHQVSSRPQQPPSPPPTAAPPSGTSTYSALVSPAPPIQTEKRDEAHPFRYSKEDLLRIYKEGGGKGGLGLEVERWEGVVREAGSEPISLREISDSEKKLLAGPLNSDLRRRQSTDYLSPLSTQSLGTERSRLNLNSPASATGSPLRERFSTLKRRDSTDQPTLTIPRKQSLSSLQPPLISPRDAMPSPRTRIGYTPNFDGVLNNSDSWVARRRASEASLKSGIGASRDVGELPQDVKTLEIREEEEDGNIESRKEHKEGLTTAESDITSRNLSYKPTRDGPVFQDSPNIAQLSLEFNPKISEPLSGPMSSGPPPGIQDLASIEWSYKDPSGQIQGPFRADLMQKWSDEGYFTPDLPVKRTHLDTQWTTVEELSQRSGGSRIFLSILSTPVPPGLSHQKESSSIALPDQYLLNGPYQPAPLQSLQSSTLDSLSPNRSDSPSSSFSGGRFGNGSPDPNAFGGRGYFAADNTAGSRVAGFSAVADPISAFGGRRSAFNDSSIDPSLGIRSPAYTGVVSNRGPADAYGYGRAYSPGQGPWNMSHTNSNFEPLNMGGQSADSVPYSNDFGSGPTYGPGPTNGFVNPHGSQDNIFGEPTYQQPSDYGTYNGNGSPIITQQYTHPTVTQHSIPQHLQQVSHPSNVYGQQGIISETPLNNTMSTNQTVAPPPLWDNEAPNPRRPGPFDPSHPTSTNTMIIQPLDTANVSPWGRPNQNLRPDLHVNEPSPWVAASQRDVEESWKEPAPDSLTFSNLGQHNQQQQDLTSSVNDSANIIKVLDQSPLPAEASAPVAPDHVPKTTSTPATKTKTKPPVQAIQPSAPKPASTPSVPLVVADPPPPSAQRPAWATEDEVKKSSTSISLRDIQEAEAKKAEARKTAERERERAARAVVTVQETKDDAQAFTASWGLPTSQAGTRITVPSKEAVSPAPNSNATPVWTTAVKPSTTKKSMKEIQEEEEKRKKVAPKETVAAAARRAYAETTNKVTPPVQNNAWTTVGPSGKPSTVATVPVRPPVALSTSTLSVPTSSTRINGTTGPRPVSVSPTVKTSPATSTSRIEDPVPPSHEFLKWLNDSLKGLNSSVNVEEIMSMLLSFPMDPDPSTVELISESIYANSTTLDGRRFAAEFISRRKTDAASRPKGASASKAAMKPISIADVVKATPKPAQPEWGFKVVNKKKKGGKA